MVSEFKPSATAGQGSNVPHTEEVSANPRKPPPRNSYVTEEALRRLSTARHGKYAPLPPQ